jgi:4-hydroxy-3-polyprenylbenzoate decarboxylase
MMVPENAAAVRHPIVLAITGASGAIYASRLLECLLAADYQVNLTISPSGAAVIKQELGLSIDLADFDPKPLVENRPSGWCRIARPLSAVQWSRLHYHFHKDFMTPIASGSFLTSGMVICPCSGSTLSGIAHSSSTNLVQRAAEVHLKERRRLVVVPRETPLSTFALENMHRLSAAGGIVLPAMPGWYHGVNGLEDLVDFVVSRILDQFGIDNSIISRWDGGSIDGTSPASMGDFGGGAGASES